MSTGKNARKINSLQALRFFAFMEIFLYHCGCNIMTGCFGVSVFIVLSGFLYGIKGKPISAKQALQKIMQLYPLHIICIVVGFVLLGYTLSKSLIYNVLLVQSWACQGGWNVWFSYNGVSWYLSTYTFVLLFEPIGLRITNRINNLKKGFIILFVLGICMFFIAELSRFVTLEYDNDRTFGYYFTYICPIYRCIEFNMGMALGKMTQFRKNDNGSVKIIPIGAVILSIVAMFVKKQEFLGQELSYTLLFTPASLMLVWLFSDRNNAFINRLAANSFIVKIAELSGYMFLIHQMVIILSNLTLNRLLGLSAGYIHKVLLILLSFVVTVICAEIYQRGYRKVMFGINPAREHHGKQ